MGFSNGCPSLSWNNSSGTATDGTNYSFSRFDGDSVFFSIMDFDVLHKIENAASDAVWLNEAAWRKASLAEDASLLHIKEGLELPLQGLIRDFHFDSFERPIGEVMIRPLQPKMESRNILIKIAPTTPYETLRRIETVYNELAGGNFFDQDSNFLDKKVAEFYEKQNQLLTMISWLTIVSLVISSMGVLTMSIYQAQQRTKEIAVRKIFGATNKEVLTMILFGWLKIAGLAFLVAVPVIIILGKEWLSYYAYHISIGWSVFAISGVTVISFTAITVIWQSLRTAYSNPVDTVKKE